MEHPASWQLPPVGKELDAPLHVLGGQRPEQGQHAAEVLTDRVLLLTDKDKPSMTPSLSDQLRVQEVEITNIERHQYSPPSRGVRQVIVIRPLDHPSIEGGLYVHVSHAKRTHQGPVHRVFVEVQTSSHSMVRGRFSVSSRLASDSSAAIFASTSPLFKW